jgi:hypothetical protein
MQSQNNSDAVHSRLRLQYTPSVAAMNGIGTIRLFAEIPPAPVPDLLNNNNVPLPSGDRLIRAAMHGAHCDIGRIDNEINRVHTLLSSLMHNHHLFCRYYYCQRALLAPVRHLPPEILSQIFLACLTFYHDGEVVFPPRKDVLLFGQISQYWRDVATSTSGLWSTMSIDLRAQNIDRELDMAMTWLARSRCALLSILLCSYSETTQVHPITNVILTHTLRLHQYSYKKLF